MNSWIETILNEIHVNWIRFVLVSILMSQQLTTIINSLKINNKLHQFFRLCCNEKDGSRRRIGN
jgi:hypothetical protein